MKSKAGGQGKEMAGALVKETGRAEVKELGFEVKEIAEAEVKEMGGAEAKDKGGDEALKATVRSLDLFKGQWQVTGNLKQVNILVRCAFTEQRIRCCPQ